VDAIGVMVEAGAKVGAVSEHAGLETPLDHFGAIRRKFGASGLSIFAYNYSFNPSFTDAEIDRGFAMARALAASFITASTTVAVAKRVVPFADFYRGARPQGRLLVGLGHGRRGALWVDLAALPHLLVGGMTGGGKSVFLRQALTALALENRPARLQLVCLDLKGGVELAHYGDLPHATRPVADSLEGAAAALGEVRVELDRRLEALRRSGMADIDAWLDAGMPAWPRMVVVVDELAELTTRDVGADPVAREARRAASARLTEMARLGRAVGIHLIVSTQRPDADAVPGQLPAHLARTAAFRVRAGVTRLILLAPQMPGMHGFQVMEGLKTNAADGYLPVLVITAQPGHKLRALQAGARDFVSKPFDLVEVETRIRNMLEVRLLYGKLEKQNSALEATVKHD